MSFEVGLVEAIRAIEAYTGKKPRKIELADPWFRFDYMGVEVWGSGSQYGQLELKKYESLLLDSKPASAVDTKGNK